MKILFTVPNKKEGGVHSFCQSVLPFFTSEIVIFRRGSRDKVPPWLKPLDFMLMLVGFCHRLIKEQPDVVLINTSLRSRSTMRDSLLIVAAKTWGNKVATYIHGVEESWLKKKVLLQGIFLSDIIFVLSGEYRTKLAAAGYSGSISLCINPVDRLLYAYGRSGGKVRKEPRNLLFLSRLEEEKGIFIILKAFAELREEFSQLNLLIAGNGSALRQAQRFVEERAMRGVQFLGFVSGLEKMRVYRESDIYLFASQSEGLPISVLEAMLFGLPVVTFPVGGLKDLFVDEKMGILVQGLDPAYFSAAARRLLLNHDFRQEVSEYNIRYALEYFNPESAAASLEQQILSLNETKSEHALQ